MAEFAKGAPMGAPSPAADPAEAMESDFSPRKIKIATVSLLGSTFATSLLPFMALGMVMIPMTKEFGWNRTEFNLANSSLMWFGALTVWVFGRITDKVGVRPVIIWGTIGVGLVTLVIPHVNNLWQFCVCFAFLGVFGSSGASYQKVIASLFTQNRGKALAIFGVEGSVVRLIIPLATTYLILHYAWRGMFTAFGIVILAIVPLIWLGLEEPGTRGSGPSLFRRKPADGLAPPPSPPMVFEGMTLKQVMRDRVFWLMFGSALITMVIGNGMMANVYAAIMDKGFSQTTAASMISMTMVFGLAGTALGGYLIDKVQTAKISVPFHLLGAVGTFLLMIVTSHVGGKPMLFAAIGLGGFTLSAAMPMATYFFTRYFGLRSFAEIYGFQSGIQALCMGFAAPLMGFIYDTTHSYTLGFMAQIGASLLACVVYLILPRYRYSADIGSMPAPPKAPGPAPAAPAGRPAIHAA
ncbi:MAG: MFS transporter [Caulobacteraceae bacterium]